MKKGKLVRDGFDRMIRKPKGPSVWRVFLPPKRFGMAELPFVKVIASSKGEALAEANHQVKGGLPKGSRAERES